MEDLSKYWGVNWTISLICCVLGILSPADGNSISEVVGKTVSIHCSNKSIGPLTQLTWKMNNIQLFTFIPNELVYTSEKAASLSVNMSKSESQLYPLVIESVHTSHTGNYSCETNTASGVWTQTWELLITEHEQTGKWSEVMIAVAVAVPCACVLIFLIALTIMLRVCKQRHEDPFPAEREKTEDIYENSLEVDYILQRGYHYKDRAH